MKRLVTAAWLIPVVLYAVFGGVWWVLLGVVAVVCLLCYIEYCRILRIDALARALGIAAGIGLLLLPVERIFPALLLFSLLTLTLPLRADDLSLGLERSAAMLLGVVYIFGAMKTGYLLVQEHHNPWWLFFAVALNWVGDTGAFYIGRRFGRHKLAPRISPGKSWEGTVASILLSMLFAIVAMPRLLPISMAMTGVLALAGNIAGQVGDLAESTLKRAAGVKDSGTLLPGHGGMLDRVDSALFTLPVFYVLLAWMRL
jgi:phosphatidate cytidylyltransferase